MGRKEKWTALKFDQRWPVPMLLWDFILALPTLTSFFDTQFFALCANSIQFFSSLFYSFIFFFLFLPSFLPYVYCDALILIVNPTHIAFRVTHVGVCLCRGRCHSYHRGRPLCKQICAAFVIFSSNRAPPDMVSGIIDRDGVSQLPWLFLQCIVRDVGSVIDGHVVF